MDFFDYLNPLKRIEKTLDAIGDLADGHPVEAAKKVVNPLSPTGTLLNAIDLIPEAEHHDAVYGDIIGVQRKMGYKHFGVYIGKGKVIHYASKGGDFGGKNIIHETTLSHFIGREDDYFILEFPSIYGRPREIHTKLSDQVANDILRLRPSMTKVIKFLKSCDDYHLYSPKETVRRAKSRLGESDYNLATNNCEHFAIWCKTGISESHQINMLIGG